MRSPWWGIDPRVNIGDLSSDVFTWSTQRFELMDSLEDGLFDRYGTSEDSFNLLRRSFYLLRLLKYRHYFSMAPFIGGIYVERALPEQFDDSDKKPYTPVSAELQETYLEELCETFFAPGALAFPESLLPYLQPERRGFDFIFNNEDPKILERILREQAYMLYRLLNPETFARLSNSQFYGGEFDVVTLVDTVTDAIFKKDRSGEISMMRRNLQLYYTEELLLLYKLENTAVPKAALAHGLNKIKKYSKNPFLFSGSKASKSHRKLIQKMVKDF